MKRTRFLAPALAALLVASASAQQQSEIIVESFSDGQNASAFQRVEGNWYESISKSKASGLIASKSMFKTLGEPGAARFKPPVPADGKYDVYVTFPTSANASGVVYVVGHAGGQTEVRQDQFGRGRDPGTPADAWIPLGTFEFKQGGENFVEVRDPETGAAPDAEEPNKRVYADAVRLTPNTGTPLTAAVSKLSGSSSAAVAAAPAAPAVPAAPAAPATPPPDLPGLSAAVTAPAEGLPSLAAAVPTVSSALPGLSAASAAPAQPDAAQAGLPGLSAASATPSALPALTEAAAPATGLPGLQAATAPAAAAAPPPLPALTEAAPSALPGLEAATAPAAGATPAALPGLQAATAAPDAAPAPGALPGLSAAVPTGETPALPLLSGTPAATAPAPTPAPMETPAAVGIPAMPPMPDLPIGLPPIPTTAPPVAEMPAAMPPAGTPGPQVANISWAYDIGAAQAAAETGDKRILVFMNAKGNRVGMKYETEYFNDPAVRSQIDRFVPLKLDFPTSTRYAYKLGLMGAGKLVVIDRAETVLLMVDQIPPSAADLAKLLEGVK